jgi:serine/threonine protein kinase
LAVGRQFGAYTLSRKLARGGMADIFLATRRTTQGVELCVIKMMLPKSLRNPEALKLFLGEAHLAARLEHPNIVRILQLDRVDDYYFIAMEYIPGETLFHLLHQNAKLSKMLTPWQAAGIAWQACHGLGYAHGLTGKKGNPLNVVHRDISLSNIILSYSGQVKILDFGIAAAETRTAGFPQGKALGKSSYMSPEQCKGAKLDRRSDLFSLGIVLWELSTGGALFPGSSRKAISKDIVSGVVPRPSRHNSEIPARLEEVIMKALATRPKDRFQDAHEMGEALKQAAGEKLPTESDLAAMLEDLFSVERAEGSAIGEIGEEIALESLLFDDLDAQPPRRDSKSFERKRTILSRTTIRVLVICGILLIAAICLRMFGGSHRPTQKGTPHEKQQPLKGRIKIESSPQGARIEINRIDSGLVTPASISDLSLHEDLEIGLFVEGYVPWFTKVRLESTERRRINAILVSNKPDRRPRH